MIQRLLSDLPNPVVAQVQAAQVRQSAQKVQALVVIDRLDLVLAHIQSLEFDQIANEGETLETVARQVEIDESVLKIQLLE